ncbi:hypothetical protein KO504_14570 [Winogradskyella psychrotolerans]|uniref:hypothetical protein n=1 Tax=Winogradskyella psychrotolerans TaxID=1344585 RepID=UPI001C0664E2|nr:hypothetical protein [Winogradskyella psychrotolerans]MBU2922569.1 hypothetical protein [Winogradskyella psychrotolerans]
MKTIKNLFFLLTFSLIAFNCSSDDDNGGGSDDGVTPTASFSDDADAWSSAVAQGAQTTGADLNVFGWTYTASQMAAAIDGLSYDNPTWTVDSPQADETHSGFITADETWTNDRFHILDGKVYVQEGVTLTIEPGTIIKGAESTGSNASALIVAQGGMINANGTASAPIIFTAASDNIALGTNAGTNLSIDDRALWGGVLVLGKAQGSFSGDAVSIQIEGLPATEPGSYGGTNDADNSGVLNYISIRHGGAVIGSDNEINGLTLGGVGSGTTISNIEVVANLDDGIEWFAGAVNVSNPIVWGCADDLLDIDEAFSGTISNALTISTNVTDHAMEIDGPAGSFQAGFTIDGLTMIGDTSATIDGVSGNREYSDLRDGALATINNVYAYGFRAGSDVELDDATSATNYAADNISFSNWQVVYPSGDDNSVMWNDTTVE